ncbi:MAG: precorrin-6y C5,15-methyltransferase (decarboxylating) subunit CbiE [Oscillospiraceae bacterium]|nr:precorrin-6y C5,15-methyltransferase (decarboxylating) subunit CbiE [Oscillospiraceae bacterium]
MRNPLWLVGGGSGEPDYLLPAAKKILEQADCVIASQRFGKLLSIKKFLPLVNLSDLLEQLPILLEKESIAILVSGDPLLYSFYHTVKNRYPDWQMDVIPGISSLQLLGAKFGLSMEQAYICSLHGKPYTAGSIACAVTQHSLTFFFCSAKDGVREIAKALCFYGLEDMTLFVGADLTHETEQLWQGPPKQFCEMKNPPLCVVAVSNPHPKQIGNTVLLPDAAFLRNGVPMTKEEVRAVILSKLQLQPDSVVWDIGAGTGSVSISCAKCCPFGMVYAIEYQTSALDILKKNCAYLQAENVVVLAGRAEQVIATLPTPDCIFIGGSGGACSELLQQIQALPKVVRLVISSVTLETQAELTILLQNMPQLEVVQVAVGRSKIVGKYHVLENNHPVMLFSCLAGGDQ